MLEGSEFVYVIEGYRTSTTICREQVKIDPETGVARLVMPTHGKHTLVQSQYCRTYEEAVAKAKARIEGDIAGMKEIIAKLRKVRFKKPKGW